MRKTLLLVLALMLPALLLAAEPERDRGGFARFYGFTPDGSEALVGRFDRQTGLEQLMIYRTADGMVVQEFTPVRLLEDYEYEIEQGDANPVPPPALTDRFTQPGIRAAVSPAGTAAVYSHITHDADRDVRSSFGFRLAHLTVTYMLHNAAGASRLAAIPLGTTARAEQPVDVTTTYWTPDGMRFAIVGCLHGADPAPGFSVSRPVILVGRVPPPHRAFDMTPLTQTLFDQGKQYYKDKLYRDAAYNFARSAALRPRDPDSRFMAARCYGLLMDNKPCLRQLRALGEIHTERALKLLLSVRKHDDFARLRNNPDFMRELSRIIDAFPR